MDGARAPQGLDAEDRIALGLGASHLFYLVIFSMAGWGLLSSPWPGLLRYPTGVLVLGAGALLAWGKFAGRPLDKWILLYAGYRLRTRQGSPPPSADVAQPAAPVDLKELPESARPQVTVVPNTARRKARRVAFYSQAGGSGKTALAFECATLVASLSGSRVAVVDLDMMSSTMRVRTGLDGRTLDDLLTAEELAVPELESVLLRHPGGARVVVGSGAPSSPARVAECVRALLTHLDEQGYVAVVLDVGTGALDVDDALSQILADEVDAVYCLFTPTAGGILGLYRAVATLRRRGLRNAIRLVLNRHDAPVLLDEVLGDLRVDLLATIPTLTGIAVAENTHFPGCLGDELVADALYPLADDIYPEMTASWFDRGRGRDQAGMVGRG